MKKGTSMAVVRLSEAVHIACQQHGKFGETISDVVERAFVLAGWLSPAKPKEIKIPMMVKHKPYLSANRGKVSKTILYRAPILRVLHDSPDHTVKASEVLERIKPLVCGQFTPLDRKVLPSNPSVRRWQNKAAWCRQELVDAGLVTSAGQGLWKLTDAGVVEAKKLI